MFRDSLNRLRLVWALNAGQRRRQRSTVVYHLKRSLHAAPELSLTPEESALVSQIQSLTAAANRNNLTRTSAYLEFYRRHPKIHWALLAHMVSRNGGWNMTDLKGDWLTRLESDRARSDLFAMLERANWLIFHDAFPQLLLYEESEHTKQNLLPLLPAFGVSRFMSVMWAMFLSTHDCAMLTRAFIINEQNYIESRVIQNEKYASPLSSMKVQLQSFLNLNQVLLPYRRGDNVTLAGTTMQQFGSVCDRIETGLRLYRNLYQDRFLHRAMVRWVNVVEHTGSRSDYWPDIFTPRRTTPNNHDYQPRFVGQRPNHRGIFSPYLGDAWPDVNHEPAESSDWFQDFRHTIYLFDDTPKQPADFTDEYIQSIRTMENIVVAKQKAQTIVRGV